jgi:hypothetical protein
MGKTQPALSHHLDQVPEAGPLNCHEHGSCDAIAGLEGPLLLAVRNSHSVSRIRVDRNSSDEKVGIHHRVSIRIDIMVECFCLSRIERSIGSVPAARSPSCARTEMGLPCLTDRIAAAVVCAMGTPYTVRYPCRDTTNLGIETTARAGAIHSPFSSAGVSLYPTQGSVMR